MEERDVLSVPTRGHGACGEGPEPESSSSTQAGRAALSRRRFLQAAVLTAGSATFPQMLASCAPRAKEDDVTQDAAESAYDKVARSVCAPNCVGSCGIKAFVKDDVIVKVEPADFPDTAYNRICLRGISNAMQRVYSPDRVKYPMKCIGERGSGEWERISWNEAVDLIYEKMQANIENYGPTSNAWLGMTGNYAAVPQIFATLMAMSYGGTGFTNFGIMGDLGVNLGFLPPLAVHQDASSWEDLIGAKSIIMFGCNYAETNMQEMHFLFDAQEAGSKLVVVDPRFSRTASKADWWIPIRPGTDAALIMAIMRIAVETRRYDEAYVRSFTNAAFLVDVSTKKLVRKGADYLVWDERQSGAVPVAALPDELKPTYPSVQVKGDIPNEALVPETAVLEGTFTVEVDGDAIEVKPAFQLLVESLAPFDPASASAICEVPAEDIERLADLYLDETPSNLRISQGTNRYWNGHLPTRAAIQLAALCGNIGKPHANINWAGGTLMRFLFSLPAEAVMPVKGMVAQQLPGTQWMDIVASGDPCPVKMLWINNYGWGTQGPEREKLISEVLPQLDFVVVSEQIMNAGTDLADLVLPVTTYYEEPFEVVTAWSSMYVQVREQAISPMYEAKTDWEIGQMLAERFGVKEGSLWELDIKDYYRDYVFAKNLAPEFSSMDFDELCDKKVLRANFSEPFIAFESQRFQTPSGKVELYTEGLVDFGEELACFYEPYESNRNEKAADYPLTFMNCRTVYTTHSQHVNLPWIREVAAPEPWLEMAPADAEERGIASGDTVRVFNERGEYRVKVLVTAEIKPGCINQRQGWWPKDFPDGSHYSSLLHMELNPAQDAIMETNFAPYDNLVQVERV